MEIATEVVRKVVPIQTISVRLLQILLLILNLIFVNCDLHSICLTSSEMILINL